MKRFMLQLDGHVIDIHDYFRIVSDWHSCGKFWGGRGKDMKRKQRAASRDQGGHRAKKESARGARDQGEHEAGARRERPESG